MAREKLRWQMDKVLLTSETFVKDITTIDDNLAGKYLIPAITEAQDIYLRMVLGSPLLEACCKKVESCMIDTGSFNADFNIDFDRHGEGHPYKQLIDNCQHFLAYRTAVDVLVKVSYKIANIGASRTSDDNVQPMTMEDINSLRDYYIGKADFYCELLQQFILRNKRHYPELDEGKCDEIRSHLHSSATCGLFLGGVRGKGGHCR